MGGSRANDNDRKRIAATITGADSIVRSQLRDRAREAVEAWNLQIEAWHTCEPSPSIGAALNAEYFWLEVLCQGCRQVHSLDLRTLDMHPLTPLANVTLRWRCGNCTQGTYGPMSTIRGLKINAPESAADTWRRKVLAKLKKETGGDWQ